MSQEKLARFALLFSIFAFGTLGLVACDDDDETATAETEVITSDSAAGGPVDVAGGPDACGDFHRRGPGGYRIRIDVTEGVVVKGAKVSYEPHDKLGSQAAVNVEPVR